MPEKSYYTRLYAFQDEIMKITQRQEVDFYLTGGTALSRCYLNHRYSDDLDFFINEAPGFKKQAQRVVTAIRHANFKVEIGTASESFFRITVLKDQTHLIIDFVNDRNFIPEASKRQIFFLKLIAGKTFYRINFRP